MQSGPDHVDIVQECFPLEAGRILDDVMTQVLQQPRRRLHGGDTFGVGLGAGGWP